MPLSVILIALSLLLGYQISRQFLIPGRSAAEALTMAPLVAVLLLIWGAGIWGPVEGRAWFSALLMILNMGLLPVSNRRRIPLEGTTWGFNRRFTLLLGLLLIGIISTVLYYHFQGARLGNWIHDSLAAEYSLGVSPPVHPFFPEIPMGPIDARDVLMGFLLPRGSGPLEVAIWLEPLLALSASGLLFVTLKRGEARPGSLLAGIAVPFFGIGSTSHLGLVEGFEENFGLLCATTILSFYLLLQVLELFDAPGEGGSFKSPVILWVSTGAVWGVSALIEQGLFVQLLLCAVVLAIPAVIRSPHKLRLILGIAIATAVSATLLLALNGPSLFARPVEGGQIWANLVHSIERSVTGNVYAWPVVLCPLSLLWLIRRRAWYGAPFWIFGGLSLLTSLPEPLWESSTSFGFAVPLGLMCGDLITLPPSSGSTGPLRLRRRGLQALGAIVLVATLLPAVEGLSQNILRGLGAQSMTSEPQEAWRLRHKDFGITPSDLAIAQALSSQILPGETVLTNLGGESLAGFWPDYVLTTLTGCLVRGRTYPVPLHLSKDTLPGSSSSPPYWRSALQKSLLAGKRLDLLWNSGIDWLVLDPSKSDLSEALELSGYARKAAGSIDETGTERELWNLGPPPTLQVGRIPSQPPFRSRTLLETSEGLLPLHRLGDFDWKPGQVYKIRVSAANPGRKAARLGWLRITIVDAQKSPATEPLFYLLGATPLPPGLGDIHEIVFAAPLVDGEFQVRADLMSDEGTTQLFAFPLHLGSPDRTNLCSSFSLNVLRLCTFLDDLSKQGPERSSGTVTRLDELAYELKSAMLHKVHAA